MNNLGLRDTVDRASHSLDTRTGGKVNGNVTTNQLFTQAVTISDGSIAAGKLDAASFEGNNIEIRSWNGIGLNSTYENPNNVASIYFDTRGGSIGLQGDISGPKWGGSFSDWVDRKTQQALTKSANGADIPDKKAFANNLGLTETAYRTIGNGTHQIPDMSFFTSGRDWFKMPDGRTIQYGLVNFSQDNDVFFYAKVRFPIPFTDRPMCVQATLNGMGSVDVYLPNLGIDLKDNMSVDIVLPKQRITRIPREQSVFWIAIGY
ncbi:NgrE [Xenorhabdus stockiae]|uniref:NgrE n=1 Tax=Xenorhabdus stockiae TaxID=351614 RepID=A0A2D0K2V9_9GAMM|nr:NgrE [Xenorhabdus stockiae]